MNYLRLLYRGIGSDSIALPSSVEELLLLDVKESQPTTSAWDFMWNAVTEDRREKQLFSKSMLVDEINPSAEALYETDEMYVTEATVKVSVLDNNCVRMGPIQPEFRWWSAPRMRDTLSKLGTSY